MTAKAKNKAPGLEILLSEPLTRAQAVERIAQGIHHIHSVSPGVVDTSSRLTKKALITGKVPQYSWERHKTQLFTISSSTGRLEVISQIIRLSHESPKRDLRERLESVLEELVTNAMFHAYRLPDGSQKYHRRKQVVLAPEEMLQVSFYSSQKGSFVCVEDQGGALNFDSLSRALTRCYAGGQNQIETKESGAGLGLYMIFEAVRHWKIEVWDGKKTRVSCWLDARSDNQPDCFSFNFFGGR